MLTAVHQENVSPRASSIYCRWILVEQKEGAHLVAVWIDSEMRAFEQEITGGSQCQAPQADAPGDSRGVTPTQTPLEDTETTADR
jgi:hypothetical protein